MKNYPNFTFRNPNPTFKFKAKFKTDLFANVKKMHLNSWFQSATPFFFFCLLLPAFVSHHHLASFVISLTHPSFTLGLWTPIPPPALSPHPPFHYCLPSLLLHPPPSASLIFLITAFRKSSHLEVLTAFSRQKPASLRDLNRGEMCDGYLPETLWLPLSFP